MGRVIAWDSPAATVGWSTNQSSNGGLADNHLVSPFAMHYRTTSFPTWLERYAGLAGGGNGIFSACFDPP